MTETVKPELVQAPLSMLLSKISVTDGSYEQIRKLVDKEKEDLDYDCLLFIANELDDLGYESPVLESVELATNRFESFPVRNPEIENLILGLMYKSCLPKSKDDLMTLLDGAGMERRAVASRIVENLFRSIDHFSLIEEHKLEHFADKCLYDYESDVLYDFCRILSDMSNGLIPNGWTLIKWGMANHVNTAKLIDIIVKQ